MTDMQLQAKAIIAAAIIESRGVDIEGLASLNKDISKHKIDQLRELTERIFHALTSRRHRALALSRSSHGRFHRWVVRPIAGFLVLY